MCVRAEIDYACLPRITIKIGVGRSTIAMLLWLRQLQENVGNRVDVAIVDLTKVFDPVSRKGLFVLLEKIGCPQSS